MYLFFMRIGGLLLGSIVTAYCVVTLAIAAEDPLIKESRELVQTFAARLQSALRAEMAEGGPLAALSVCRDVAPQIASDLSRLSGAKVSRTSTRFRNPGNSPEAWQLKVLNEFEAENSTADKPLEYFASDGSGARYMKAIRVAPVCLVCHGATLSETVEQRLAEDYPHDRATGYAAGDLRGAFSVVWPDSD